MTRRSPSGGAPSRRERRRAVALSCAPAAVAVAAHHKDRVLAALGHVQRLKWSSVGAPSTTLGKGFVGLRAPRTEAFEQLLRLEITKFPGLRCPRARPVMFAPMVEFVTL